MPPSCFFSRMNIVPLLKSDDPSQLRQYLELLDKNENLPELLALHASVNVLEDMKTKFFAQYLLHTSYIIPDEMTRAIAKLKPDDPRSALLTDLRNFAILRNIRTDPSRDPVDKNWPNYFVVGTFDSIIESLKFVMTTEDAIVFLVKSHFVRTGGTERYLANVKAIEDKCVYVSKARLNHIKYILTRPVWSLEDRKMEPSNWPKRFFFCNFVETSIQSLADMLACFAMTDQKFSFPTMKIQRYNLNFRDEKQLNTSWVQLFYFYLMHPISFRTVGEMTKFVSPNARLDKVSNWWQIIVYLRLNSTINKEYSVRLLDLLIDAMGAKKYEPILLEQYTGSFEEERVAVD